MKPTTVEFIHANYKTPATVFAEQVFAVFFLPTGQHTVIVGPGSVALPVTETVDEAVAKIKAALIAAGTKE